MADWIENLKSATKTCLVQDGKRKIHYTFKDGSEMVEEYTLNGHDLIVRKHKKKTMTGKECNWDYEVGQDLEIKRMDSEGGLVENIANPIFTRKDMKDAFQWRIRNLPYPHNTYQLSVDDNSIIIKTTNKKYYKKFIIPDMNRLKLKLDPVHLSSSHANNTLIITYKKPKEILEHEKNLVGELKKLKNIGDGDSEMCPVS